MKYSKTKALIENDPEAEERTRLADVQDRLAGAMRGIDERLARCKRDIQAQKTYLWENTSEMDHVEKAFTRQAIEQILMTSDTLLGQKQRLRKLALSPYFGRFDFVKTAAPSPGTFYIGVHHFHDEQENETLVYDWRAPVASLFYDFEPGPAAYEAPSGKISGEVTLKRQFRIRGGEMEFMLESGLNIVDDVLQQELARASDDEGMKNIVATIQRDQNAIIRDEHAHTLIIQGVAGSGKTSIALHRIAFLLYRFKDTLTSGDILIISPNRVFAAYISNVLPELGEESVAEIGMEQLADELLDHSIRFQTFFEQTAALLASKNEEMKQRITFKSSVGFLKKLGTYAKHVEANRFIPADVYLGKRLVPGGLIGSNFAKFGRMALGQRITHVIEAVEINLGIYHNHDIDAEERRILRKAIKKMYCGTTLRNTYKAFYDWLGKPELFKTAGAGRLEYADVFPLIYLKLRLEGIDNPYRAIKHLIIDEMQDYTPVQYAVVASLFPCRKTVLGDVAQAVNPYSASGPEEIRNAFSGANYMTLSRSYRSTLQIMQFAQQICFNPDLLPMERHGETPRVLACQNRGEEVGKIRQHAAEFLASPHNSLGIICKTQKQAEKIAADLKNNGIDAQLLDPSSAVFSAGVIVCSAHMAKGLEFDRVILPHASAANYHTPMDRNLLYVACTRAMHVLVLTCTGEPSHFLPGTGTGDQTSVSP